MLSYFKAVVYFFTMLDCKLLILFFIFYTSEVINQYLINSVFILGLTDEYISPRFILYSKLWLLEDIKQHWIFLSHFFLTIFISCICNIRFWSRWQTFHAKLNEFSSVICLFISDNKNDECVQTFLLFYFTKQNS